MESQLPTAMTVWYVWDEQLLCGAYIVACITYATCISVHVGIYTAQKNYMCTCILIYRTCYILYWRISGCILMKEE